MLVTIEKEIIENKCKFIFIVGKIKKQILLFETTTKHEEQEETLEDIRGLLETFFNEIPISLWILNADETLKYAMKEIYDVIVEIYGDKVYKIKNES